MTRSANEVMTLAAKAARGAGAPPAQAAEFGRAVVCHLIAARDVAEIWVVLKALPKGPILTFPTAFARLAESAVAGQAKGVLACETTPELAQSYAEALPFSQSNDPVPNGLRLTLNLTKPATHKTVPRIDLPEDLAGWMADLAARTFVPESEASRLAGAGAGLTDND